MLENWDNAIVTDINVALYVAPGTGKAVHQNRPFHGFVLNDDTADKYYYFSDGTRLHARPNEVQYLPIGSTYRVEPIVTGGCWAINFSLLEDITEKPFHIRMRNPESALRIFKEATAAWKEQSDSCNSIIRKSIYDIIVRIKKEHGRSYLSSEKELLIKPAVDTISRDFTKNDLSVKDLSALCGISEAYFRRIFMDRYSLSPKEYIISLRMEYAKRLLQSTQFSVSEVAEMCGYFEPCHFSREFSKHTGVSPKMFAKAHTEK